MRFSPATSAILELDDALQAAIAAIDAASVAAWQLADRPAEQRSEWAVEVARRLAVLSTLVESIAEVEGFRDAVRRVESNDD